jgi:hypothetical protein
MKLYLETSVWNFLLVDDAPEKAAFTEALFLEIDQGKYEIFISDKVQEEIEDAREEVRARIIVFLKRYLPKVLSEDDESRRLVKEYLREGMLAEKHVDDLIHLSIASVNEMDKLVSWNLRHLVKSKTRTMANAIYRLNGYRDIEICTPEEVVENED